MAGYRGYIQGQNLPAGVGTFAWPEEVQEGDLCWLYAGGSQPQTGPAGSGWTPVGHKAWWKVLDLDDLASPLQVTAERIKVLFFFGAERIGASSQQASVKVGVDDWAIVDASRIGSGSCVPSATYLVGAEWVSATGRRQATLTQKASRAGTLSVAVTSGTEAYAYQVVTEALPLAPTLRSPYAGARISTLAVPRLEWMHRGGTLREARVELTGPMGIRNVTVDGTLFNGEWWLPPIDQVTLAASLPAGTYTWRVMTVNYTGDGPFSSAWTFFVDVPPTVPVPTVASPHGSLTPTVTPGTATPTYGIIEQHRITIAPADSTDPERDALWSTGTRMGAPSPESAPATTPWINGAPLRAWVTCWQTGNISTTTASAVFPVSWTPTAAPTVSIAAGTPPMVTVGGTAFGRRVQLEQLLGATWTPLTERLAAASTVVVGSPLLALGRPVRVRARQAAQVSGVWLWSDWVETPMVTCPPVGCYLVDDVDRAEYLEAHATEDGSRETVQGIASTYGLGGLVRVDQTPEAGERGRLTLAARTSGEADAIGAWLAARRVWWYVWPPEGRARDPQRPVRMMRDVRRSVDRVAQSARTPARRLPVAWVEAPDSTL